MIHHFRPQLIDYDSLKKENIFHTMILLTKLQKRSLVFQVCWTPRTCWTRTHRTSSASSPMSPSSTTYSRMRTIQDHHLSLSRKSLLTRKILSTQLNHHQKELQHQCQKVSFSHLIQFCATTNSLQATKTPE